MQSDCLSLPGLSLVEELVVVGKLTVVVRVQVRIKKSYNPRRLEICTAIGLVIYVELTGF